MLRTTRRHQTKAAGKLIARASWKEAARLLAAGTSTAEVARRLGCSRLRLVRMMNHDLRLKALLARPIAERAPGEAQACGRIRTSSRSEGK